MQVTHSIATTAGRIQVCADDEFVCTNGLAMTVETARAVADALHAAADRAERHAERQAARYKKQTIAHALQLLASVQ